MVAVRAVHVPVGHFFRSRRANIEHRAVEAQALTGQWVIAVDDHLAVGNIGHRVHLPIVVARGLPSFVPA